MRVFCLLLLSAFIVLVEGQGFPENGILTTVTVDKVQYKQDFTNQIRGIHRNITWATVPFKKQGISSDVLIILEVTDNDGDITVYTSENVICDPTRDTGSSNTKYIPALYKGTTEILYFCIHKQTSEPQNLDSDRFSFYYDAAQEVEYGDRVEVTCTEQETDKASNIMYMITRMPSPKSSPSVEVVLDDWFDDLSVYVSVNVPPVEQDYEYTVRGDSDLNADTNTYDIEIPTDLDTNDVVYTRVECPVSRYSEPLLNYTYSMGAPPVITVILASVFGSVFGALILIVTIGGVVNKPFKKDVDDQNMIRMRYFLAVPIFIMSTVALPFVIIGIVFFNVMSAAMGGAFIGAAALVIIIGLIFTGPTVFTLNKTTDEFIITKHWLLTLPSRSVYKLSDVISFEFGLSRGKKGSTLYSMQALLKGGGCISLESGASNVSVMKRENMMNRFNFFLSSIRVEGVNQKHNMLREMDPNAIADYLVKHPEDSELVAQVLKEQTAPPPETIHYQKLNMLREMETSAIADYLVKHPEDHELVAQVLKEKANTPYY